MIANFNFCIMHEHIMHGLWMPNINFVVCLNLTCVPIFIIMYHHAIQTSTVHTSIVHTYMLLNHQYGRFWYIGMARVPHMRNTNIYARENLSKN